MRDPFGRNGGESGGARVVIGDVGDAHAIDPLDLHHAERVNAVSAAGLDPRGRPEPEGEGDRAIDQPWMEAFLEQQHAALLARQCLTSSGATGNSLKMRRAKIVCTIGPASQSQEMLEQLLAAGMDVARLNFSHGTHDQHRQVIEGLRAASLKVRKAVGILGDLQGPKIRTGQIGRAHV